MSSWKSKLLNTLPFLTKIKENSKNKEAENLIELLQPIDNLELDSDSIVSILSDVFEEFHKNSPLKPIPETKKYLTKYEADKIIVEGFTEDFKRTIVTVRTEQNILNNELLDETEETITSILTEKSNTTYNKKNIKMEEKVLPPEDNNEQVSESSYGSGVWQILAANKGSTFQISPPGFNIYQQKQRHWSERPAISWVEMNESKLKCEKWLNIQY